MLAKRSHVNNGITKITSLTTSNISYLGKLSVKTYGIDYVSIIILDSTPTINKSLLFKFRFDL